MQIVFTNNNDFLGLAVRFFERLSWIKKGRTSHTALRYGREENKWMVEAIRTGFVPNWWPKFLQKNKIYKKFEVLCVDGVTEDILEKIIDDMLDNLIDEPYDFTGFVGLGLVVIWYRITGKHIKNFLGWPGTVVCSQVVYKIFQEVKKRTGVDYFGNYDDTTVFPEELLIECEKRPNQFKLVEEYYGQSNA
jgi:hypothetical protein